MKRLFRAGTLALALLSGCDYFKNEAAPQGVPSGAVVVDAGKKEDASPSPLLDERLEKYFVEDRIEREGMVLGKAPEELIVNDEKTEYLNSIFVEGTEQALRAVEQVRGRIISKIGETYELFIPAHSVEERETVRNRLEQQAIESFAHHILLFGNHLDTDAAERRGVNTWAYTHIQLPEMQHAIRIEERQLPAIAVIDSGFESDELNIVYGYDFADRDGDVSPSRGCLNADHGTMTSGIIAARNNGRLLNGVAPGAPLYVYKVQGAFSFLCLFGGASENAILAALEDVKTQDVVAVNMSLGVPDGRATLKNKIRDVIRTGKLVVNAADNSGENINYKASIDGLVVVGGTQITTIPAENGQSRIVEERWGNSNYWTIGGSWLAAPAADVAVIGTGKLQSGTSFSAPFVTGLGAMLMSYGLSAPDAFLTMQASADQIWVTYPDSSRALWHRINAYRAVCSVADCGEQRGGRDAGISRSDAGREERDVGRDERDAGRERDAGAPERDAGRDSGANDSEDAEVGGGIIDNDARQPEPAPDNYELYVLSLPPDEQSRQVFSVRVRADCTIEEMLQMTNSDEGKRSLRVHPQGALYTSNLLINDHLENMLTLTNQEGDIRLARLEDGMCDFAVSQQHGAIAITTERSGEVYVVQPGQELQLLGDVSFINGRLDEDPVFCSQPLWRPDGLELAVHVPTFLGKLVFFPFGVEEQPQEYRNIHKNVYWINNQFLAHYYDTVIHREDRTSFHRFGLAQLDRSALSSELIQEFDFSGGISGIHLISGQFPALYAVSFRDLSELGYVRTGIVEGGEVSLLDNTILGYASTSPTSFSSDGRLLLYYGVGHLINEAETLELRRSGHLVDEGFYLYDRQTRQHCFLLGNATEAVWK